MGCERESEEREEDSGEEALLRSRCTTYFFVFEILAATASDMRCGMRKRMKKAISHG